SKFCKNLIWSIGRFLGRPSITIPVMAFDRFTMDTFRFAVGVLVTACGLLSGLLFVVRIRRRDNALLYFALGATMYGVRLLLGAGSKFGAPAVFIITFLIPVPLVFFLGEVVAPGWRKVAWAIVAVDLAVAVVGLGARMLGYKPAVGSAVNS